MLIAFSLLIAPKFFFSEIADASPFWYAKVQRKVTHCAILGNKELRRQSFSIAVSLASHWLIFVTLQ